MNKKRKFRLLSFSAVLVLSLIACFSTPKKDQTTTMPAATNPPTPSSTRAPLPSATSSPIPTITSQPVTATSQATPASNPEVKLFEVNSFKDDHDYWYFYGMVRNDTDQAINNVKIKVRLLDSNGVELYTSIVEPLLLYLNPGEVSPFSAGPDDPYPDGESFQPAVESFDYQPSMNRATISFYNIKLWPSDYDDVYLSGEVYNSGTEPVLIRAIAGTLTNQTGGLVTAAKPKAVLSYLKPDGISPFVMEFHAPPGKAASLNSYNLYSNTEIINPIQEAALVLSETNSLYQDYVDYYHLAGQITNNAPVPLNARMIAGLYDENWNCLDAAEMKLPLPVNPGETLPYDFSSWSMVNMVPGGREAVYQYLIIIDRNVSHESYQSSIPLSTEGDSQIFEMGFLTAKGSVVNNSGEDISVAVVNVALYDKVNGGLVATNYSAPIEPLTAGAKASYQVYVYPPTDTEMANINIVITAFGQ